jgi:hypothetical protein
METLISQTTQQPPEKVDPLSTAADSVSNDNFLQELVGLVNLGSTTFGITLQVSGMLLYGVLIGGKEYFQAFGEAFGKSVVDSTGNQEMGDSFKALFAERGNVYDRTLEPDDEPIVLPVFIHLRNVYFLTPGLGQPIPVTSEGVLWRGRISEVSGFVLGNV